MNDSVNYGVFIIDKNGKLQLASDSNEELSFEKAYELGNSFATVDTKFDNRNEGYFVVLPIYYSEKRNITLNRLLNDNTTSIIY